MKGNEGVNFEDNVKNVNLKILMKIDNILIIQPEQDENKTYMCVYQ